jgi:hypothetical protein
MTAKAWFRVLIFGAMALTFFALGLYDVKTQADFARYGKHSVATVTADLGTVRRGGRRTRRTNHVLRIEYDGRTAKLESSAPPAIGSQMQIQYIPGSDGDMVRPLSEDRPWWALFFVCLGILYLYLIVREFQRRSWWTGHDLRGPPSGDSGLSAS